MNLIVQGFVLSAVYMLVSLGFGLLLSIANIFNFAHGAIYMVGGFITYGLAVNLGINQWLALLASMGIMGVFGLGIERLAFRRFAGNNMSVLMVSIALIFILQTTVNVTVGGFTRSLPPFVEGVLRIGSLSISWQRITMLLVAVVLLILLTVLIRRTMIGMQMLAVAQDKLGATLQGISIQRVSAIAMVLACVLAALAGSMMASLLSLTVYMGDNVLFRAIQVVVIGGIGSVGGIAVGSLIIGFLDAILPIYMDAAVAQSVGLAIIIGVLLFRPRGLFGYESS